MKFWRLTSYCFARGKIETYDTENKYRAFQIFSVITNIYNKKTKEPTLMELFTATGKLKKFFLTTRDVRCVHHG
jgi:hypothetical protein